MNDQKNKKTEAKILPDEDIIELYWQRDESAISATDVKYGKYLFSIAYNVLRDKLDCEECVNDTYLGTWNIIPPTRPNAFQMFLSKITRNIAVDKFRKKTALIRVPAELTVSLDELDDCLSYDMSAERMSEMSEIVRILNEFLESLDERDAFMFICRYYYSDDVNSIAKMTELSKTSVYRELARMREELRKRLDEGGISV